MDRFDLARLTDFDFETVCKDIFEVEMGTALEIFAPGPDSGIDLRHISSDGTSVIIQCKHWHKSGRAALVRHIETSEAKKVAALAPQRYVLATSVDLTAKSKEAIRVALDPHVLTPGDLWGVGELEAALGTHDEIVRRHLRLWLSSAAVLGTMLGKEILLRSSNLLRDIDDTLLRYAPSPAFVEAQRLLEDHKVCVISGIPGIGKTTLAQVLAAQYVAEGYELVEISRDIEEALRLWDDSRLQIFYYDDFLGQTSLRDTVATNEDSRLIRFITQVERAGNKLFVLTTREYILAQARQVSEKLNTRSFDVANYLLDLESYSTMARAEVLYNHIYFSQLPASNRAAFAEEEAYGPIVEHRNFNPRLIALTLDAHETLTELPEASVQRVLANLDDPKALWNHMFDYQLSDEEVDLAEVVFLSRRPLELAELTDPWLSYSRTVPRTQAGRELRRALASLEGTLLRIDRRDTTTTVQLHNPSVRDYMRSRLSGHPELVNKALTGITDISQLETLWITATGHQNSSILSLLKQRSAEFERLFLSSTADQDFSTWTATWTASVALYIGIADKLGSSAIAAAVADIIHNKRPDYVEDPSGFVELFGAMRGSAYSVVADTEESLMDWAVNDMTQDLSDWNLAQTVKETLSAIGGERALRESADIEERLDDEARDAAQRLAETGALYASQSEAAEMLDRLDAYANPEKEFVGYHELARSVETSRAAREDQAQLHEQRRPDVAREVADDREELMIATMMASLLPESLHSVPPDE